MTPKAPTGVEPDLPTVAAVVPLPFGFGAKSGRRDSNPRPSDYRIRHSSTELPPRLLLLANLKNKNTIIYYLCFDFLPKMKM